MASSHTLSVEELGDIGEVIDIYQFYMSPCCTLSIHQSSLLSNTYFCYGFFFFIMRHFLISKVVSLLNLSIDYIQPSSPTSLLEIFALSDPGKHFTCGNFFLEKVFIVLKYNAYNYKPQKCIKMKVSFHCHFYLYIFILFYFICG